MIAIIAILATAAVTFIAHLVYGALLAGREYDRSEQAWTRAEEHLIPQHSSHRPVKPLFGKANAIRT